MRTLHGWSFALCAAALLPAACGNHETSRDLGLEDLGRPDAAMDAALPDASLPDASLPDATVDAALPDAAVDAALPDAAMDAALPDATSPDLAGDGASSDALACTPTVPTAIAQGFSRAFAIDADFVYGFSLDSESPGVVRVPKGGGTPERIVVAQTSLGALLVDDTSLYFIGAHDVLRAPKSGGTPTDLAASTEAPAGLAIDDANVYWSAPGGLFMVPKAGGTATELAPVLTGVLASDGQFVYYGDGAGISRVATTGGAPEHFVDLTDLGALATDAEHVYAATTAGRVVAFAKVVGASPVELLAGAAGQALSGFTLDDTHVYVATTSDGGGRVEQVDKDGSGALERASTGAFGLGVDGAHLYWVDASNQLVHLCK